MTSATITLHMMYLTIETRHVSHFVTTKTAITIATTITRYTSYGNIMMSITTITRHISYSTTTINSTSNIQCMITTTSTTWNITYTNSNSMTITTTVTIHVSYMSTTITTTITIHVCYKHIIFFIINCPFFFIF